MKQYDPYVDKSLTEEKVRKRIKYQKNSVAKMPTNYILPTSFLTRIKIIKLIKSSIETISFPLMIQSHCGKLYSMQLCTKLVDVVVVKPQ